jgi:cytochrome c peroxidase
MRVLFFSLLLVTMLAFGGATLLPADYSAAAADQFIVPLPAGISADLWSYFLPKDNQLTAAKVELGRRLFFDPRLSADATVSCATCHDPKLAFTDGKKTAIGIGGRHGARNTPTILNAMFNSSLFWDGRSDTLEAQSKEPLINPDEMGNASLQQVVSNVASNPEYATEFQNAFNGPVSIDAISKAIAAYERTLVSGNAPLDRFLAGDTRALSEPAQRGFNLFRTKARCTVCHNVNNSFPFLTDGNYRNTGVAGNFVEFEALAQRATALSSESSATLMTKLGQQRGKAELGRFMVSGNALDVGAFRTPSLRNVELTAPYFHDGSAATLADVLHYYMKGGNQNTLRDWELQAIDLTEREQLDLIEFLKSLTGDEARRAAKN